MTAKKIPPADQGLHDACREAIGAIKLGIRVGRTVPITLLAEALESAADEWAAAEAGR